MRNKLIALIISLSFIPSISFAGLTAERELKVRYDGSNYATETISSTGRLTLNAVGAGAGFTFSDPVTFTGSSSQIGPFDNGYYINGDVATTLKLASTGFEDLLIDLESGTNEVILTSGSGVTKLTAGFGGLQLGQGGTDGQLIIYNELGATDYTNTFNPSASQTSSAVYTLPVDEPAVSGYALTSTTAGVMSWAAPANDPSIDYVAIGGDINTAITAASTGDTLILAAGTYTITADIDVTKSLTIQGQGMDRTTITTTTGSDTPMHITASNVTIRDLTVGGSGSTILNGIYVDGVAGTVLSGIRILNVRVNITSGNNGKVGIEFIDASGIVMNPYVFVQSSNGSAYGIGQTNASTAEAATLVQVFNAHTSANGGTSNDVGSGYLNNDSTASVDAVLEIYGGQAIGTEQDGAVTKGYGISLLGGANAVTRVYGAVLNGTDIDVIAAASTLISLYGANLANGTFSGTITNAGTLAANDVQIGNTGVLITDDGDGAITFLGRSAGNDEDLTINLDDTADAAVISSSTGVASLTLTGMGLTSTATGSFGWTLVDGTDNTTGDSQCTSACVMGIQNATGAAITGIVSCTDATADQAYCAGAS